VSQLAQKLDNLWVINTEASQRRLALKERAIAYLGGKCQICGYDKCPSAFDFHHVGAKDFNISAKSSWAVILPELRRCTLLCSNCHREVHSGWHPSYLKLED
jgi:predicted HNH restriction endonuclease